MEIISLIFGLVFALIVSFVEGGTQPFLTGVVVTTTFGVMWGVDAIIRGICKKDWRPFYFFWNGVFAVMIGAGLQFMIGDQVLPWWANLLTNVGSLVLGLLGKTVLSNFIFWAEIRTKEHYRGLPDRRRA